jgi:hypothetical protein
MWWGRPDEQPSKQGAENLVHPWLVDDHLAEDPCIHCNPPNGFDELLGLSSNFMYISSNASRLLAEVRAYLPDERYHRVGRRIILYKLQRPCLNV